MKVLIKDLKEKIEQTFQSKKFKSSHIEKIVEYILWAEMSWNKTQWILKMCWSEPLQNIVPLHDIKIERETPCSQLINAGANPSIVVSQIATDEVIKKAKSVGMALVWVRNTFSSNWAQAFYAEKIARNDLIWIVVSRSPWSTAPFNSISPLFWTNPIWFSFPTNTDPIVFDFATSAITYYGLILANMKWENLPYGVTVDKDGNITTSPKDALKWAVLPFDKWYKGSCLSMMVELLSWPLVNGAFCDYETFDKEWGSTFIAIDPNILVDIQDFKLHASKMVDIIRSSPTKFWEIIRLPWDKSKKNFLQSLHSWYVDVEDFCLKELWYI